MKAVRKSFALRTARLMAAALVSAAIGLAGKARAAEVDVGRYAWEFPVARDIPREAVAALREELLHEIDDVLAAGPLTPWRVAHADEAVEAYFVYLEPGRIVATLAWAYPHLPADRQAAVTRYVHEQFSCEVFAPWNPGRVPADVPGTRREFHPLNRVGNWTPGWQSTRPTVQSLYGAWLWAYRANDFESVRPHWEKVKACYRKKLAETGIYATMSAHIAVLRLAEAFGDAAMREEAWQNLAADLRAGLSFAGDPDIRTDEARMSPIELRTLRLYGNNNYGGLYWPAQDGSIYRGMMFHCISPEIGRYLAENVREETLKRHAYGKRRFPLWWLVDAPYFQRDYTGDEGVGLVQPEMMGMLFPVERWVVGADAATLAGYLTSAPSCRGDCVWIECLVQAIEAHGRTEWQDVRRKPEEAEKRPKSVRGMILRVSPNGRYLVDQDGKPFFYLADTAWTLFRRLNREETEEYLQNRVAKGFTVIQAYLLRGLNVRNRYGELTLIDRDPTKPNEAWFQHVDYVINRANDLGLVMAIVISKGDHVRQRQWPVSEVVFNETNAFAFGKFVAERYKHNAVIWYLGGDTVPAETRAVWVAMARGLKAGSDGLHLVSYHGPGGEENSSSYWFHNDDWLDFNAIQSGHGWYPPTHKFVARDYALQPAKPTVDMESTFEDHAPDANRPEERTGGHQARVSAYWNFLAGAAGHGYGCNDIWQFADPASPPEKQDYTFPFARWSGTTEWRKGMDLPGAKSMGILRKLFDSRPWHRLVPDNSLVAAGQGEGKDHVQAAVADDGSFALAYLPLGSPISVRLDRLKGPKVKAQWYDPREGTWHAIGEYANQAVQPFAPPSRGEEEDWVLVLDAAP